MFLRKVRGYSPTASEAIGQAPEKGMRCEKNKADADPVEQFVGGEQQAKIVLDLANKKRNT